MSSAKQKYIEDCVKLIDERVRLLQKELDETILVDAASKACDRAAISEARHLSKLIMSLANAPYNKSPYQVARGRLGYGPKIQ